MNRPLTELELLIYETGELTKVSSFDAWTFDHSRMAIDDAYGTVTINALQYRGNKLVADVALTMICREGKHTVWSFLPAGVLTQKDVFDGVDTLDNWYVTKGNPPVAVCEIDDADLYTGICKVLEEYGFLKDLLSRGSQAFLAWRYA